MRYDRSAKAAEDEQRGQSDHNIAACNHSGAGAGGKQDDQKQAAIRPCVPEQNGQRDDRRDQKQTEHLEVVDRLASDRHHANPATARHIVQGIGQPRDYPDEQSHGGRGSQRQQAAPVAPGHHNASRQHQPREGGGVPGVERVEAAEHEASERAARQPRGQSFALRLNAGEDPLHRQRDGQQGEWQGHHVRVQVAQNEGESWKFVDRVIGQPAGVLALNRA